MTGVFTAVDLAPCHGAVVNRRVTAVLGRKLFGMLETRNGRAARVVAFKAAGPTHEAAAREAPTAASSVYALVLGLEGAFAA